MEPIITAPECIAAVVDNLRVANVRDEFVPQPQLNVAFSLHSV